MCIYACIYVHICVSMCVCVHACICVCVQGCMRKSVRALVAVLNGALQQIDMCTCGSPVDRYLGISRDSSTMTVTCSRLKMRAELATSLPVYKT